MMIQPMNNAPAQHVVPAQWDTVKECKDETPGAAHVVNHFLFSPSVHPVFFHASLLYCCLELVSQFLISFKLFLLQEKQNSNLSTFSVHLLHFISVSDSCFLPLS